ncbi:MAG: DNA-directed RNA polymerase subunit omega [bacterium]|jgi:DNA-directed RNA polymerase subunit omega
MENRDRELTEALEKTGNSAILVNLISTRTRQLFRGAKPLLEKWDGLLVVDIALREFNEGKIGYRARKES